MSSQVTRVEVGGQTIDLGASMSIEQARETIQELGIASNIGNAKATMLNDNTVQFMNEYGENGTN